MDGGGIFVGLINCFDNDGSGSGKSTLSLSMFRLMEAASGSIEIDGVDISTLGLRKLRESIGIIPLVSNRILCRLAEYEIGKQRLSLEARFVPISPR